MVISTYLPARWVASSPESIFELESVKDAWHSYFSTGNSEYYHAIERSLR